MRRWLAIALLGLAAEAAAAERIVTLAPHLAELVCAVGRCAQLAGVVAHTDAPPQAAARPAIGDAFNVNIEALLQLRPDLILAWDGGTPPATVARLRSLGLRVEPLAVTDLDGIGAALEQVGRLTGADLQGRAAADEYRQRLAALRAAYAGRLRLRAFYQIGVDPPFSISRRSPIHQALDLCGADNVFADLPGLAAAVGAEALIVARPQVVVHAAQEDAAALRRYWSRLPAPALGDPRHRVVIDANTLTRQSPRVLDGVAELCAGLDRVRAALSSGAR